MGFNANFTAKQVAAQAAVDAAPGAINTAAALQKLKASTAGVKTAADLVREQTPVDPAQVSKADIVRAIQNLTKHMKQAEDRIKEADAQIADLKKKAKRLAVVEEFLDELSTNQMNHARAIGAMLEKLRSSADSDAFGDE